MKVLVVLGGPGAGKTTLIKRSLRSLVKHFPTIVWLFNDDGSPKKTDGFRAVRRLKGVHFRPLLGGCLGCDDNTRQLASLCHEAEHELHADLLVVETYGYVDAGVIRKLQSFGYQPWVFSLLNVEKLTLIHDLSLVVNGVPVIHDQIASANLAVGLTKYQHMPPEQMVVADELVREFASNLTRFELPPGSCFPMVLIERLKLPAPPPQVKFRRSSGTLMGFLRPRPHTHPGLDRTFDLRSGVRYEDVQRWAATHPNVFRIKGTIGDTVVDYDGLNWSKRLRKKRHTPYPPGTVTLYYRGTCPDYAWMTDASVEQAFLGQHIERIEYWLEQAPKRTLFLSDGRVVTHPTPITQAILLCEQRADTPPDLMARAIRTHVAYAVQAAEKVLRPGRPEWMDPGQRDSMRALVITMTWYADQQPQDLGDELVARIRALKHLSEMFDLGLQGMTSGFFHADEAKAVEYAVDLPPVFRWIGGRERVKAGMEHVLNLIRREDPPRPALLAAWQAL